MVGVVNGILYVLGGGGDEGGVHESVLAYDPATNSWTEQGTDADARSGLSVGVVNGILYAVGGLLRHTLSPVGTVEAYNPAHQLLDDQGIDADAREFAPAVGVVNGILYAVGGDDFTDTYVEDLHTGSSRRTIRLPNSWTTKAPAPAPRSDLSLGVVNGILYVVGGGSYRNVRRRVRSSHQRMDVEGLAADASTLRGLGWRGKRNPLPVGGFDNGQR